MYLLGRVWNDDEGQDLIEYALLAALVAVAVVAAITGMKNAISAAFNSVAGAIGNAT
jgi:pilus assembly protein Flp/PilA